MTEKVVLTKEQTEQLEEIKHYWYIENMIDKEDVGWLIQQAERVQELEKELNGTKYRLGYKQMFAQCNRDYASLNYEKDRYKQALEFYANEKNYERAYDDEVLFDYLPSEIDFDNGEKARKELGKEA